MPLSKGDYVLLNYTIYAKDEGKVVETTVESIAKEHNIYSPDNVYEPKLIVIGESKLFEPLEKALLELEEGREVEVEVPPEKAFGDRDPRNVRVLSAREFARHGIVPKVGEVVEIEGRQGRVVSVSGGRVVLDFNHPLAGKTLVIKAQVVKVIREPEERVKYIVRNSLPRIQLDKIHVQFSNGKVEVKLPSEVLLVDKVGLAMLNIANEISSRFPEVATVRFVEDIEVKRAEEGKK